MKYKETNIFAKIFFFGIMSWHLMGGHRMQKVRKRSGSLRQGVSYVMTEPRSDNEIMYDNSSSKIL